MTHENVEARLLRSYSDWSGKEVRPDGWFALTGEGSGDSSRRPRIGELGGGGSKAASGEGEMIGLSRLMSKPKVDGFPYLLKDISRECGVESTGM